MLLNAEVWFNVLQKHIDDLERMDNNLLRKVMDAPSKTPIVSLYLEMGCIPVRYLLKYKRIMYLHHILKLEENHLVRKVFSAQEKKPSKDDWILQVTEDLENLGLGHLEFNSIQALSKSRFKKIVKKALKETVLEYLEGKRGTKSEKLSSDNLDLQDYLKSERLTLNEKSCCLNCAAEWCQ